MFKKVFLLLFLSSINLTAQHIIKGKIVPTSSQKWVVLYKVHGSKQDYIANATVANGEFTLKIPPTATKGIYRLVYNMNSNPFLDIIYNDENISLVFDSQHPMESVKFLQSEENNLYHTYLTDVGRAQYKLDSLQITYFKTSDITEKKNIETLYNQYYDSINKVQFHYEDISKNNYVYHFIKASKRYNAKILFENPKDYLFATKKHFFDAVDINDTDLINSTFINDKVNDFIFYLNTSEHSNVDNKLKKQAIDIVIDTFKANDKLVKDIEESLIYTFVDQQNVELANYIIDNYYEKLPYNYQDQGFIDDVKSQLRTAIGNIAPNITWSENNTDKDLYSLKGTDYYLVIFWSSTCPHCLKEIPIAYDFLKDKKNVKVVAIGLEDNYSKAGWKALTEKINGWIHIYGEGKWKNTFAKEYGINATPTFLILNTDKKILAKPDDVEELKAFFAGH